MKVYQEITIIPDDDNAPYFLWSKLYNQLHIALADVANTHGIRTIGVAFPNYRYVERDGKTFATLGSRLRIFAPSRDELEKLNLAKWLDRLKDYVHIKAIADVGDKATGYVVVERQQRPHLEKQAKRFAEFKNLTLDQALEHCLAHKKQPKAYPFIELFSQTNQVPYRLYIKQTVVDKTVDGEFTVYGMHNQGGAMTDKATVPHW